MKREYIIRKLRAAGFTFKEGSKHTKVFNSHGIRVSTIPRHNEVSEKTAQKIEEQTGVSLF